MTQMMLFKQSPEPWQPHAYQKKAVKFLLEHACAALFLDPGLGKTSITLAALKLLIKKGAVGGKVLIIAPLRVCQSVWPKEAEKWSDFKDLRIEVLHGLQKDEALAREADIYVINPEGIDWLLKTKKTKTTTRTGRIVNKIEVDVRTFKKHGFSVLVIDELTLFKHTGSDRFKALKEVHKTFGRRWGLTGSPAANGLMDLFGQALMLDEGRALGPFITKYRRDYFNEVGPYVWVPKDGAPEKIYERLAPLALRMAAEDYIDMPQLIENDIRLDLPDSVREIYDRLEEDLISKIEDRVVVAANAAVASGKCRQVANGGIYLDPEVIDVGFKIVRGAREWVDLHEVKVDAVVDLLEELQGSPLLVVYDFGHDLARLQKRLGKDVPYIGGGVSTKRAQELEALWNRGKLPVLLGHPQSIARGLNLQQDAQHIVWHSLTWDYELYDQLIRRIRRQGNKYQHVFVHRLIMRNTVDEVIVSSLRRKDKGQQGFFKGLVELAKARRKI